MKIKSHHTITIEPTEGYKINGADIDTVFMDGKLHIKFNEELIDTTIVKLKDSSYAERIRELTEKGNKLEQENILLKANLPKSEIIHQLIKSTNKLEQKNIILKADNLIHQSNEAKELYGGIYKEKICKCGCGLNFTPTGKNQKYAPNCINQDKRLKDADLKRHNKQRGK
jgi:hypothetical protein